MIFFRVRFCRSLSLLPVPLFPSSFFVCPSCTAPYLRIPLLLSFFSSPERLSSLKNHQLRQLLDAVLFEPDLWEEEPEEETQPPAVVPAPDRESFRTPVGLLFNELRNSPQGVMAPVLRMIETVVEMDTGRFTLSSAPLFLYVVRLAVRMEAYILYLVRHHDWMKSRGRGALYNGVMAESLTRGLNCSPEIAEALKHCVTELRGILNDKVLPILEHWCNQSLRDNDGYAICVLYTHLALLFQNTEREEVNQRMVTTHLCAQIILNSRHQFGVGKAASLDPDAPNAAAMESAAAVLGIPDTAVFDLFASQRSNVLHWLDSHPEQGNQVMEAIIRVVTLTGTRTRRFDRQQLQTRSWEPLSGRHCQGRFVPTAASSPNASAAAQRRRRRLRRRKAEKTAGRPALTPEQQEIEDFYGPSGEEDDFEEFTDSDIEDVLRTEEEEQTAAGAEEEKNSSTTDGRKGKEQKSFGLFSFGRKKKSASSPEETTETSGGLQPRPPLRDAFPDEIADSTVEQQANWDIEINVQLGDFTLQGARLQVLEDEVGDLRQFLAHSDVFSSQQHSFGSGRATGGPLGGHMQCAPVELAQNRRWYRLVGMRHDLIIWDPDVRLCHARYLEEEGGRARARVLPGGVMLVDEPIPEHWNPGNYPAAELYRNRIGRVYSPSSAADWLQKALAPVLRSHLHDVSFSLGSVDGFFFRPLPVLYFFFLCLGELFLCSFAVRPCRSSCTVSDNRRSEPPAALGTAVREEAAVPPRNLLLPRNSRCWSASLPVTVSGSCRGRRPALQLVVLGNPISRSILATILD